MKCEDCGANEATHHNIQKVNGRKSESHLCRDCYVKRSQQGLSVSPFGDLLKDMENILGQGEYAGRSIVCNDCGTASDRFLSTGFVGCENCYTAFAPLILPRVQKLQHSLQHTGKRPAGFKPSLQSEIGRLKAELKEAVEVEDFERADSINRKLKELSGGNR